MKKKIGVIDDHAMFRKSLVSLINCFSDCEVILEASNGEEMIQIINPENLPDLVLLDMTMPIMDGYEAATWLRQTYPDIKILVLSTMSQDQAIIKMIQRGARGYILKDADPSELKSGIKEVMDIGYFYNENVSVEMVRTLRLSNSNVAYNEMIKKLTPRERTFLQLACSDRSYQQIADEMKVSMRTVDGYRDALFKKFNVASRVGMVIFGLKNEMIKLI